MRKAEQQEAATQKAELQQQQEEEEEAAAQTRPPRQEGPSEYELERERNVARNRARMAALGILGPAAKPQPAPVLAAPRKRPAPSAPAPQQPMRRSRRISANPTANYNDDDAAALAAALAASEQEKEPEVVSYVDDSTVRRYLADAAPAVHDAAPMSGELTGYTTHRAHEYALSRGSKAYSLDAHGSLVAAAGHGGVVHVHAHVAVDDDDRSEPLLCFKAHTGWISDVRIAAAARLLTSSNDGTVSMWNLERTRADDALMPERTLATKVHGGSGIFAMDVGAERGASRVVTAAKDGGVAVSSFDGASPQGDSAAVWRRDAGHAGVAKSARWRDANVFGSAGNDGAVRLWDVRAPSSSDPVVSFAGMADGGVVNFAEFQKENGGHLCACTGFAREVCVFDLRKPGDAVHTLQGHCGAGPARVKALYRAAFTPCGGHVVVAGPGSASVSLYAASSGRCVSRGAVGFDATCLGFASGGRLLLAGSSSVVSLPPFAS